MQTKRNSEIFEQIGTKNPQVISPLSFELAFHLDNNTEILENTNIQVKIKWLEFKNIVDITNKNISDDKR